MRTIKFTFEDSHDARQFVIMLMQAGIIDLELKTSWDDYKSTVTYEIDELHIDANDSIEIGVEFLRENGLNHISHEIIK